MVNKKSIYIAFDSDILRTLTLLDILKKEHGFIDINRINDKILKKDFNYFVKLYNSILNNEIRPLIVDAVYQESKHSTSLVSFMKSYCYFPNVNAANYQEKTEKARQLADAYTKDYANSKYEIQKAPMKKVFVADIKKYVPTNDCYIMAEATIENCPLLTSNGQDFIFNKRNSDKFNHERVKGIVEININNGYYKYDENGNKTTPKPVLIHTLTGILKYEDYFEKIQQSDNFVKADAIL